jgi:hypothetical protein
MKIAQSLHNKIQRDFSVLFFSDISLDIPNHNIYVPISYLSMIPASFISMTSLVTQLGLQSYSITEASIGR